MLNPPEITEIASADQSEEDREMRTFWRAGVGAVFFAIGLVEALRNL